MSLRMVISHNGPDTTGDHRADYCIEAGVKEANEKPDEIETARTDLRVNEGKR
jgi:hypothetical protein